MVGAPLHARPLVALGGNRPPAPRRTNFDMALFKHVAIHENVAFEFRAEAFNVFNHTEWNPMYGGGGSAPGDTNNVFGNPGFLQVTSTHLPRILQLGAKILF